MFDALLIERSCGERCQLSKSHIFKEEHGSSREEHGTWNLGKFRLTFACPSHLNVSVVIMKFRPYLQSTTSWTPLSFLLHISWSGAVIIYIDPEKKKLDFMFPSCICVIQAVSFSGHSMENTCPHSSCSSSYVIAPYPLFLYSLDHCLRSNPFIFLSHLVIPSMHLGIALCATLVFELLAHSMSTCQSPRHDTLYAWGTLKTCFRSVDSIPRAIANNEEIYIPALTVRYCGFESMIRV